MHMQGTWELSASINTTELWPQLCGNKTWRSLNLRRQNMVLKDDFSRHLWQAGVVVLEDCSDSRLYLWRKDGNCISTPQAEGSRFWWDLEPGDFRDILRRHLGVCAFTSWEDVVLTTEQAAILNRDDKTVIRLERQSVAYAQHPPLTSITLNGLRGYEKHFAALRRVLQQHGCPSHTHIPLQRMLQQAGIPHTMPLFPTPFYLEPQEPARTAICRMGQQLLKVARQYESGMIADTDTEFVHQYRVNMRRFRSLVKQGRKALAPHHATPLGQTLKQISARTGTLRDLDVFILDSHQFDRLLPEELHPGLEQIRSRLQRKRTSALTRLRRFMQSEAYAEQVQICDEVLELAQNLEDSSTAAACAPVLAFAGKKIVRQYKRLCASSRKISHKSADTELHNVRIQVKQLRYLLDMFQELLPSKAADFLIRRLKKLQDRLGRFNDVSVQRRFIDELLHHENLSDPERASLSGLSAILFQSYLKERSHLQQRLAGFCTPKIRTNLEKISAVTQQEEKRASI